MIEINRIVNLIGAVVILGILVILLTGCIKTFVCTSSLQPGCDPMTKWHYVGTI